MRWPLQPQMLLNIFQVLHNQGTKSLDVSSVHLPRVLGTEGPRTYSFLRLQIHRQQGQILFKTYLITNLKFLSYCSQALQKVSYHIQILYFNTCRGPPSGALPPVFVLLVSSIDRPAELQRAAEECPGGACLFAGLSIFVELLSSQYLWCWWWWWLLWLEILWGQMQNLAITPQRLSEVCSRLVLSLS